MKKLFAMLLALCLLASLCPVGALAEAAPELPEGYVWKLMDGHFLLPVAPNADVYFYEPDMPEDSAQRIVAEVVYWDADGLAFDPFMVVWWFPNNMSAYFSRVHPLDYAKELTKEIAGSLREEGCTVQDARAVYGMRRGDVYYMLCSMHVAEGSYYADGPHDLWVYQRWYGTYDMGTYYFEIYGPTRESVEAIVKDVELVVFGE